MNEKICAWEGRASSRILGRGRGMHMPYMDELVVITVCQEKEKSGEPRRDVMRMSLHDRIKALTGWKKGDVLDMDITGEQATVFRADVGVHLCDSGPNGNRMYIRFAFGPGVLDGFPVGACRDVETKPGRLAFLLPYKQK